MRNQVSADEICRCLDESGIEYSFFGDRDLQLCGVSELKDYRSDTITWIKSIDNYNSVSDALDTADLLCVVTDKSIYDRLQVSNAFISDNSKFLFFFIVEHFFDSSRRLSLTCKNTVIGEECDIADDVQIGCNCVIGNHVRIAGGSCIYHNVTIHDDVVIGHNCTIKSGAVIGEEGFGYSKDDEGYYHVPHVGSVVIGDNVEIGGNTCIDRGTIGNTIIGDGTKIDNLCHIGHNDRIGRNVCMVGGTVIGGSTVIKDGTYIAPGAVINNQLVIGENAHVGVQTAVIRDVDKGSRLFGVPARNMVVPK